MQRLCKYDSKSCKLSEVLLKRIQQRGTRYHIPEVERWWNKPLSHEARRNITRSNVISSNVVQWNVIAAAVYHLISHAARYYVASAREPSCESKSFRAFEIFFSSVFTFLLRILAIKNIRLNWEHRFKGKSKFVCQIKLFHIIR